MPACLAFLSPECRLNCEYFFEGKNCGFCMQLPCLAQIHWFSKIIHFKQSASAFCLHSHQNRGMVFIKFFLMPMFSHGVKNSISNFHYRSHLSASQPKVSPICKKLFIQIFVNGEFVAFSDNIYFINLNFKSG